MIDNNLTHFIASDAHHSETRPFIMNSLFEDKKLRNHTNDIQKMIDNAELVINDQDLAKTTDPKLQY